MGHNSDQLLALFLAIGIPVGLFVWCWRTLWGKKRGEAEDETAGGGPAPSDAAGPGTAPVACPSCGYDVRATPDHCPECGTTIVNRRRYLHALTTDWPDTPIDPRKPAPDEELVVIVSTADAREADLLREQFNARGIACSVAGTKPIGNIKSSAVFYRVVVYRDDADLARLHLRRFRGVRDAGSRVVEV